MTKAIEAGIPKLRIEEAAAKTQARIDAGVQSVIGVNKYAPIDERPIEVLKIDNSAVAPARSRSFSGSRQNATQPPCMKPSMRSLGPRIAATATSWHLPLMLHGPRQRSGKSQRHWKVFGRHRAEIKTITGVYKRRSA